MKWALAVVVLGLACSRSARHARERPQPAPAPRSPVDAGTPGLGTIEGEVAWDGPRPSLATPSFLDPACTFAARPRVSVTGGLVAEVMVRLPLGALPHPVPDHAAVITQSLCNYLPRVTGLVQGQTVRIDNLDATLHNVHARRGNESIFNIAQPQEPGGRRDDVTHRLADLSPGDDLELRCDVHPQTAPGHLVVWDHPGFAVTGSDGRFRISGVPAGRYLLEAWHPDLGAHRVWVVVEAGTTARVRFGFQRSDLTP